MNRIQIAAKLYQTRDAMKFLFGDQFPAKVAEWKPTIEAVMRKHGVSELGAIVEIGKRYEGPAMAIIIAVAVEMAEPSEVSHA